MTSYQKEYIYRMRNEGKGYKGIAALLGLSENTVKSFCKRNNLGGLTEQKSEYEVENKMDTPFCKNCGKPLDIRQGVKPRKFCSDKCRLAWWNAHTDQVIRKAIYHIQCTGCGNPFDSYGNKNRKYCTHACYIKARFRSEVIE